jgi:multidrug efflux system outer membrane protein
MTTRRSKVGAAALCVAALLAGCAVTQPAPPVLDLPPTTASAAQNELLERWWTAFDDPALTQLVDEALANNLDLKASLARIDAARSQILLAQANLAPNTYLAANAERSRVSTVGTDRFQQTGSAVSNDYRVTFELSYEIDVWGKLRSGALAAENDLVASRYFRETVRTGVAADVASAYFQLRAADAELAILEDTLATRTGTVELQRDRFAGGIIGEYDLRQAEAERHAVVADIARTKSAIGQLESALATLTGRTPREVFAPQIARGVAIEAFARIPTLPEGLPSGLVARRPDIRRAEALLAASELRVQEARTNYFPAFTLTGAYGSESAALADLFTSPAAIWRLGLGLLQPLLTLKYIESQVELAEARRLQTTVEYQQIVQVAFREVHDALVVNARAHESLDAQTKRRDDLAVALELANLRYDAGRTSFLEVLDAQRSLLAAQTLRIVAARDAKLALVGFAKALGGGWSPASVATLR